MEKQQLVSQFSLQFAGPIHDGWQVATESDLLSLPNNYKHKLVWCLATRSMYFLQDNCDGSAIDHWKVYGKNFIKEWSGTVLYDIYECVYDEFGIYIAIQNVPAGTLLTDYNYWLRLSTNIVTIYREFQNVKYLEIPTLGLGIQHPLFQVYINESIVDTEIERVETGDNETWRISFYENGELTEKSGYVVIK